jgi:hypothetical protein
LFTYSYEILLAVELERFDRKKVLGADFEIALAFKKHFLMSGKPSILIQPILISLESKKLNISSKNPLERPSTAPQVQRPHTAHGTNLRGSRKFVGRFK